MHTMNFAILILMIIGVSVVISSVLTISTTDGKIAVKFSTIFIISVLVSAASVVAGYYMNNEETKEYIKAAQDVTEELNFLSNNKDVILNSSSKVFKYEEVVYFNSSNTYVVFLKERSTGKVKAYKTESEELISFLKREQEILKNDENRVDIYREGE